MSPFLLRGITYLSSFLVLLFLEWRAPFTPSGQRKVFRVFFHLGISAANAVILYLVMAGPLVAAVTFTQTQRIGLSHLLGLNGASEILLTVIAFDLWDYWMHLANHRIGLLWRFHKAHHSDEEVDVTTASRFHLGELIISGIVKCVMIFLWGPSLWGLAAFEALLTAASQFHHSSVSIPLKLQDSLEKLVVTPRMHRCHHVLESSCLQTNFATILSIWDRLFGSYHWARERGELDPVGVPGMGGPATMHLKPFLMTPFRKG